MREKHTALIAATQVSHSTVQVCETEHVFLPEWKNTYLYCAENIDLRGKIIVPEKAGKCKGKWDVREKRDGREAVRPSHIVWGGRTLRANCPRCGCVILNEVKNPRPPSLPAARRRRHCRRQ